MKTKWMIIPVMVIALACSREIETNTSYIEGEFTLYATSAEQETKTVLQSDGSIFWSPSDCINVFYGSKSGKFTSTNTKVAESAEFTGSLGAFTLDGTTEFVAAYPYSDQTSISGNTLSLSLPAEQTAMEGTFADDLFICVAKSKNYNLHFYNVCGGVKFSLARDGIKKVVFKGNKGENLAGLLNVKFSSDGIPQVGSISDGKTSITLVAPNGGTFKKGSWYDLVISPQELSQGYTMEFYADQLVETVSSDSSASILRSNWGVLKDLVSEDPAVFGAVDLGLSVKWANMNLGATKPEEYGDYYAWGETEPYYRSLDPIVWKSGKGSGYDWPSYTLSLGSSRKLTKYNFDSSYGNNGFTDGKTDLDPIDDAAHVKLGGEWRMPTLEEVNELGSNCKWVKTTRNGVEGDLVTGPNGESIFLPYAGYWDETSILDVGSLGAVWLPSLAVDETPNRADVLLYDMSKTGTGSCDRCFGFPIRPVYGDITVESVSLNKTDLELSIGEEATLTSTILPSNATNKNVFWSSSNPSVATVSSTGGVKGVVKGSSVITVRTEDGGKTATCRVTVTETKISVSGVSLNKTSLSMTVGETQTLTATVTPSNATDKSVTWSSSNTSVATVSSSGVVSAKKAGAATITVTTYDGGKTATCAIMVTENQSIFHEWVDLGLPSGTKWATCNMGASRPEEFGDYFAWAETEPKTDYSWTTYKWYDLSTYTFTKYSSYSKLILDDDAARVNWGEDWKIPAQWDFEEIVNYCSWEWTKLGDSDGYRITSYFNGNSIFLPAAGYWSGTDFHDGFGVYWTSYTSSESSNANCLLFVSHTVYEHDSTLRWFGCSVRPIVK